MFSLSLPCFLARSLYLMLSRILSPSRSLSLYAWCWFSMQMISLTHSPTHTRTFSPTPLPPSPPSDVLQIGAWRIGQANDDKHFSIWNTETRTTSCIYRADGTEHVGPRWSYQNENQVQPLEPPSAVIFRYHGQ